MIEVTVGQVAGIMNGAVVVVQLTFPLAVVFVLVGILKDSNNAVTWSVVGPLLNASLWPTILRTDTAATTMVSRRVRLLSTLLAIGLSILIGASIVTPLGLYDGISQCSHQDVEFGYAPDLTPMGQGTESRADYNASRLCGWTTIMNCPGQGQGWSFFSNLSGGYAQKTGSPAYISSVIPSNITEIFSSGSTGDRGDVAKAFDIEYRSFIVGKSQDNVGPDPGPNIDQGRKRTKATFHMYTSLVLNDRYDIVEGLIADTKIGGIGFRNHTLPVHPGRGSEWSEGLLWIQPETVCVSTNLSLDYTLSDPQTEADVALTDRGGLVGLTSDYPHIDLNDTQARPEIYGRAYKGAVLNNFNLMKYFNETRNATRLGKSYMAGKQYMDPSKVGIARFPDTPGPVIPGISFENVNSSLDFNASTIYVAAGIATRGFGNSDYANMNIIAADTGILLGAASRVDGGPIRLDPGSMWSAPIHSCATALKTFVMDVTFLAKDNNSLANLQITSMKPRTYLSNTSTPLWAVEDTGMMIMDASPLWAIVDDKYENRPNIMTLRKDSLYLPAGGGFEGVMNDESACASATAPEVVLHLTYSDAFPSSGFLSLFGAPDYSGLSNYPMFLKWQQFSQSPETSPTILNLVWTDLMANYVLGTNSILRTRSDSAGTPVGTNGASSRRPLISVCQSFQTIDYDMRYGIPAFVLLPLYVLMIVSALILWIIRPSLLEYLKLLLNQTATGRAVTHERHGAAAAAEVIGTEKWIKYFGDENIGVGKRPTVSHAGNAHKLPPGRRMSI